MPRTVNSEHRWYLQSSPHNPIKYEDIVKNLKGGLSFAEQCEALKLPHSNCEGILVKALRYKVNQVYVLDSIVKKFRRAHHRNPVSVEEITDKLKASGAFKRIESAALIFPLLITEAESDVHLLHFKLFTTAVYTVCRELGRRVF